MEFSNISKELYTMTMWGLSRDVSLARYLKIINIIHINRIKRKKKSHDHLNQCRKTFDKIQHPLMIFKILWKLEKRKNCLTLVKNIYRNLQLALYLMVKGWISSLKIRNKARMPTVTTLIQHCAGSSCQCNKARKELKHIQIRRKK